ncbi:cytochrome P450 6k1-like [Macrosteles quadrilineatus]|uniref:cytochrome P450 6k1-like n=1 Tax=Macrosteles quadrilineatus TaxID=74068 RepID=UPI0023E2F869|nr:cytochrome P450 6k1-like [Macrosteles quadrilineatus]XP_054261601.1 cytochrome P450 6k1-like [Macrosteles quadrilineatus]
MLEVIVLALLGAATLLYLYINHIYGYWNKKGLTQPPTKIGFGNVYAAFTMKTNLGIVIDEIYRSYPEHDAVGIYSCLTPKLLVRSPELIKTVTVTEFSSFHDNEFSVNKELDPYFAMDPFVIRGEEWKPQRAKLVTRLTPARMKEIFPLMKDIIPRLRTYIDDNIDKDFEAKDLATLFSMDIVSDTVFGISSNCFSDQEAPFRKFGDIMMKEQLQTWWKTLIIQFFPHLKKLFGFALLPPVVCKYLEEVVQEVIAYRKNNGISRNDLFQFVLKKESGDFKEVMHFATTFFIEGFETASMVASSTIYELAMNPDVQEKLYDEVKSMYNENEDIDYETVTNSPYLDNIIQESQRKYPVLYYMDRLCTKPCHLDIDGKSVEIETGTPVILPMFAIHRDPLYYPNPEVFDPERFNAENKAARPAYTYIPFGEGPRICPGMKYGLNQVKLFVSSIVQKYKILKSEKTPEKITFSPNSFLVTPNERLWIRLEKRK